MKLCGKVKGDRVRHEAGVSEFRCVRPEGHKLTRCQFVEFAVRWIPKVRDDG